MPKDLLTFLVKHKIDNIFWNNEFGVNETDRDIAVERNLNKNNIQISRFNDQVIFKPGYLKTGQGNPFSVFTPFKRRWIENFEMDFLDIDTPKNAKEPNLIKSDLS